jgi:hypothetical protein
LSQTPGSGPSRLDVQSCRCPLMVTAIMRHSLRKRWSWGRFRGEPRARLCAFSANYPCLRNTLHGSTNDHRHSRFALACTQVERVSLYPLRGGLARGSEPRPRIMTVSASTALRMLPPPARPSPVNSRALRPAGGGGGKQQRQSMKYVHP